MQVHIHREGEDFGPYPLDTVNNYLASGWLHPGDQAWYEGAPEWMTLAEVPGVVIPPLADAEPAEKRSEYHHVATWKFAILAFLTLGFYELYWFYRNWKFIKQRDGSDIWPFWRAVFSLIWIFPLAKDIGQHPARPMASSGAGIASAYLVLAISWKLPDPGWLLSLFTVVPLCFLVRQIDSINLANGSRSPYFARFGVGPVIASFVGGAFLFLAVAPIVGWMVPEGVVAGEDLRGKDRQFLEAEGMLRVDENPLLFYSVGLFSVADEGNLLTDRRVVSYFREDDGELWVGEASFNEIYDIIPYYSDSEWEDTEVYIQTDEEDEDGFFVALATVNGGDHLFVDRLTELWESRKPSVEAMEAESDTKTELAEDFTAVP